MVKSQLTFALGVFNNSCIKVCLMNLNVHKCSNKIAKHFSFKKMLLKRVKLISIVTHFELRVIVTMQGRKSTFLLGFCKLPRGSRIVESIILHMASLSCRKRLSGPSKMAFAGFKRRGTSSLWPFGIYNWQFRSLEMTVYSYPEIGLLQARAELELKYIGRVKFFNRFSRFCFGFLVIYGFLQQPKAPLFDKCLIDTGRPANIFALNPQSIRHFR